MALAGEANSEKENIPVVELENANNSVSGAPALRRLCMKFVNHHKVCRRPTYMRDHSVSKHSIEEYHILP